MEEYTCDTRIHLDGGPLAFALWDADRDEGHVVLMMGPARGWIESLQVRATGGEPARDPVRAKRLIEGDSRLWLLPAVRSGGSWGADVHPAGEGDRSDVLGVLPVHDWPNAASLLKVMKEYDSKSVALLSARLEEISRSSKMLAPHRRFFVAFDFVTNESIFAKKSLPGLPPGPASDPIRSIVKHRLRFARISHRRSLEISLRGSRKSRLDAAARNAEPPEAARDWVRGTVTSGAPPFTQVMTEVAGQLRSVFDAFVERASTLPTTPDELLLPFLLFTDGQLTFPDQPALLNCEPDSSLYFVLSEFALSASVADTKNTVFWFETYTLFVQLLNTYALRYGGEGRGSIFYEERKHSSEVRVHEVSFRNLLQRRRAELDEEEWRALHGAELLAGLSDDVPPIP